MPAHALQATPICLPDRALRGHEKIRDGMSALAEEAEDRINVQYFLHT
jgi:hypothetical protein